MVIAQHQHAIESRDLAVGVAMLLGERLGLSLARDVGDGDRRRAADQALLVGAAVDILSALRARTEAQEHKSEADGSRRSQESDRVDSRTVRAPALQQYSTNAAALRQ